MRSRLFRSRVFWLGVPGLVFLLSGWWISMGHSSQVAGGGVYQWWIGQVAGDVVMCWDPERWPDWGNFHAEHDEISGEDAREWKTQLARIREVEPDYRYAVVPYYTLVLSYLAVWLGFVVWRSQKYRLFLPATAR